MYICTAFTVYTDYKPVPRVSLDSTTYAVCHHRRCHGHLSAQGHTSAISQVKQEFI